MNRDDHGYYLPLSLDGYFRVGPKLGHICNKSKAAEWEKGHSWPGLYGADGKLKCQEGFIDLDFRLELMLKKDLIKRLASYHRNFAKRRTEAIDVLRDHVLTLGEVYVLPSTYVPYEDLRWSLLYTIAFRYKVEYSIPVDRYD